MSRGFSHAVGFILLSNALLLLAILYFASGFFPYKPFIPGSAQYETNQLHSVPPFDKIVFMVVDALRSDFVFSDESNFFFVQELIRKGDALPFTAHAAPPTITMPKVKAMTTGSVPSFLDVILNFAESDTSSTLAQQDTWLSQLKNKPGSTQLVMYGDDTWLKLLPGVFGRYEGTSSFFVSDFTEVDNNVTRNIPRELQNDDWSGMIMHYLGLDHIGHKSGPRSPHMKPKQMEMDSIVRTIFEAMVSLPHLSSTVLVLCGDHGMNDAGNHGGSAPGETSPALVFISPKFRTISEGYRSPLPTSKESFTFYDPVEQSDITPTLAGLLGFPIPLNSLGVFIPRFLTLWPEVSTQLDLLRQNANQVLGIVKATFRHVSFDEIPNPADCIEPDDDAFRLLCLWYQSEGALSSVTDSHQQKQALLKFLRSAQIIMGSTASNYDVGKLYSGTIIAILTSCLAIFPLLTLADMSNSIKIWSAVIALGNGSIMFASSFVEEEQHFWFWTGSAWLTWLCGVSQSRKSSNTAIAAFRVSALLVLFRLIRRWNQTGQKHAGSDDIGRAFLLQHSALLWLLVGITLIDTWISLSSRCLSRLTGIVERLFSLVLCLSAFLFKITFAKADSPEILNSLPQLLIDTVNTDSLLAQARIVFTGILFTLTFSLFQWRFHRKVYSSLDLIKSLHAILTLFLIAQTKVHNIPLFLFFRIMHSILTNLPLKPLEITVTSITLQYATFFAFGGSNAISSVDLSNSYNGIGGYNVLAVGILTFVGNWAGPIWWAFGTIPLLQARSIDHTRVLTIHIAWLTLWTGFVTSFVMAACTALRTHLFIWTVFSPKYLYTVAWNLGNHICVNILLTMVVWRVVS